MGGVTLEFDARRTRRGSGGILASQGTSVAVRGDTSRMVRIKSDRSRAFSLFTE